MPGNEHGDRVHNFFAQDNSSQGQDQSNVQEGNWPVINNNFWVGNQRQIDVLKSSSKNYPSQNSEIERGQASYPVHASHGLHFSQSNLRPDIPKGQYINEQQYSSGVVDGKQLYQNRQNEANFLAIDTDSNQRHVLSSRGLSIQDAQQRRGHEQQEKASDRSETSIAPVSFDLFGGQSQMNYQQASMLHALQRQQSGLNDMQLLQQQIMIRKMQEFQMQQQQLKQLDLRHQDPVNQVLSSNKQTSGSQSSNLVNVTSNSDALQYYPWTAEPGTSWLSRGSTAMQGSPSEPVFPPNLSQKLHLMDLAPQQADQSLYGVPVSSSRGLAVDQYSQMMTDRSSMSQMATYGNSLHGSQYNFLPDQIGGQVGTSISRPKSHNENHGLASSQSLNIGRTDKGGLQPVTLMQRNAPQQHFSGRQELATQSDTSQEKSTRQVSSSPNDVALDPAEEKILFGSDDNLWSAFGKIPNMSGEAANLFDNGGSSNGFPSIQSGSWSALMQSAVAETSSSDIGPQEEWSGLNFHNTVGSSANQPTLMHNDFVKKAHLPEDDVRIPSSLYSGSIRSSEDIKAINVMGPNQPGHRFQNEPGIRVSTDAPQRFRQSLDESSKWSNHSLLQQSVAEWSQIYGNASQHILDAERTAEKISATRAPGQTGTKLERNGWNALGAVPPGGDGVLNNHEAELSQKSQNNRLMVMQGGAHGSSLWKSNSVTSSAIEFGPVKVGDHLADKGRLSLNDVSAPVANSCNTGVGNGTSAFVQNNNLLNQWKSAHPPAKFQGIEGWRGMQDQVNEHNLGLDSLSRGGKDEVRRPDIDSCAMKENSNDSHLSNLSQHAPGGYREVGLSSSSDSRSLPPGKQKLTNQLASKVSVPRKFQYHPLGNLDEEPTFDLKQPTQVQASSLQNTHPAQSSQVSRYSAVTDKGEPPKDDKGPNEEPSHDSFPGGSPRMYFPFNQPLDSYAPNKASSPSQNMLELLHKVDQSRNDGVVTHLSSEGNISSQPPEAEKSDGFACHIQHGQSSVSKGFGLQLGPPSQRLHITDLSLPSQNVRDPANSMHTSHAGAEMGEKMLQTSSVQSLPFPNEGSLLENDISTGPGHPGDDNSLYKAPGNYHLAYGSDTQYSRSQLQNKQITRGSGKMAMDEQIDSSFSCNISHSTQRGYEETVLPDASYNTQKDNLALCGGMAGASDIQERGPAATQSTRDQIRSSQHFVAPVISRQGASRLVLQNMWNSIPSPQHPLAAQYPKAPSHLSAQPQPNIVESSPHGDLHVNKEGHLLSELSAIHANSRGVVDEEEHRLKDSCSQVASFVNNDSISKVEEPPGKESSIKDNSEDSPDNSASTQKDIEAFGRSLKPNVFSNKNYALLNQMRALKDAQTDPSIRISKRVKGPDNIFDVRHVHLKAGQQNEDNVGDTLASSSGVPSEDSRMFSFSSSSDIMQRNTSLHGNIASQDIVVAGLDGSRNNPSSDCTTSVRVENHQVTPQMAPSWFNQYGPLKNGQMPIHNEHKVASLRPDEPPSTLGKSSSILDVPREENITAVPIGACQVDGTLKSAPTLVSHAHFSSAQSWPLDVGAQHQVILRPYKRKSATSELDPWHREISDGSQNIFVLSAAEGDWNKAANRLNEKVQDDTELIEDGSPLLRSKRRLILTTQLMQQLFRPPPATILSADASSTYECVTYALSRVALGDACCAVSRSSDLGPRDCLDLHSMKGKLNDDPRFENVVEELLGKSRKLEDDFLRLDKSASILNLRVEFQDLERFSVINRFAKFHGRGQTDNVEVSTDATGTTQKPCVQRYATAVPMPKNLPDRMKKRLYIEDNEYCTIVLWYAFEMVYCEQRQFGYS
ncbi:hypothetical protein PHJA_001131900 [Phtheirospermum japonicum]|uniref:Uncharacterized protein n=1 Tax=Phtheirospermum japonicum TaxID=374723 RepID=A0A830C6K9_9LAMI|nr:hypothetical protein PHJA_001131900 [Phtheirospermum japonicum]